MRPHEKLDAWNKAIDFVEVVYRATESFPRDEQFGLTSQIRRAAVSIPANIAEGAARTSTKEFAHFLSNAQGSASELETELLIASRLGFLSDDVYSAMRSDLDRISSMVGGLLRNLRNKMNRDR